MNKVLVILQKEWLEIKQQRGLLLSVLLPLIIPSVIAAYSIVGEKTNKTLEPLLDEALVFMFWGTTRLFQHELILTKWM